MNRTTRTTIHIGYALAAAHIILATAATISWIIINWLAGCGEIDHTTRTANLEACILHPANNWR
jgi:hypothetical protein